MSESDTVEVSTDVLDEVYEVLEDGMENGETAHSHDDIRPSTAMIAADVQSAYELLVGADPRYEVDKE